jgi:hypothetical protein
MASQNPGTRTARQTLTKRWPHTPSEQEKQVLSSYVLGYITLEEANDLLHQLGRFLIAICEYQVASA